MNVAVFGLGYVGCVSASCLADLGHHVTGVDVNVEKTQAIASGQAPIVEPLLAETLARTVDAGRLRAVTDAAAGMDGAEVVLVCVGTPSRANGDLDFTHLDAVLAQIGESLHRAAAYPVIVIRSTVVPGTLTGRVVPLLERHSGRRAGIDFGACVNPEFLREGTAIADFHAPPFTVVGAADDRSAAVVASLYAGIEAPLVRTAPDAASMVKYASNGFHALKIAFANEIGTLCARFGTDPREVMDVFCRDDKLNISPAYLRPGFAFGGSCLPKDLRALVYQARHADLDLPLLETVLPSNRAHLQRAVDAIESHGRRRVGVLGLSFKAGTDDLRESPLVILVETLLGRGYDLRIYDEDVSLGRIFGANRKYINGAIPHLASLMCESVAELVAHAELVVVGKRPAGADVLLEDCGRIVIELAPQGLRAAAPASPVQLA